MSRILDQRGRLFGKVNVVDLLVVVVIVAVVVFAASRVTPITPTTTSPVRVTFSVQGVRNDVAASIQQRWKVGTLVYNQGGTPVLGKIESIKVSSTQEEFLTQDGQLKVFASPLLRDVTVVITGDAVVSSSSISIGGKTIMEGDTLTIVANKSSRSAMVMGIASGSEVTK